MNRARLILQLVAAALFTSALHAQTIAHIDVRHPHTEILHDHLQLGGKNAQGESFSFNSLYMEQNGQPAVPVMGEFHYVRTPVEDWDESLKKIKAAGINIVSTYVFWNIHEENEGKFDWSGSKDLRHFVQLCKENNLKVIVRLGPFCHGEIRNGGLPDWLYGRPFNVRSNDPAYLKYVDRLYAEISKQLTGLLFKDGGPIIGFQLENEYHHSAAPWAFSYPGQPPEWTAADEQRYLVFGSADAQKNKNSFVDEGRKHMAYLLELAHKTGLEAPLYTATGWGNAVIVDDATIPVTSAYPFPTWAPAAPSPLYLYRDLHNEPDYAPVSYRPERYPSFGAELGGGIMITYSRRPTVSAHAVEALVIRELGSGANAIGYYMFHGGATPRAAASYLSEEPSGVPKISYDFQAPIGQYGQLAESYGYLKLIHYFLTDFGSVLAPMVTVLPEGASKLQPTDASQLRFAVRTRDDGGFVFLHNFQDHVPTHDLTNLQLALQTSDGELRIPNESTFTLKNETATFFPFNIDFGPVRLKYATAQPVACLTADGAPHYIFAAVDGIDPEFAFNSKLSPQIQSKDCQIATDKSLSIVHCQADKVSEFTVADQQGKSVTFAVFPKSLALNAWMVDTAEGKRMVLSESTVLNHADGIEACRIGSSEISLAVYPSLKSAPKYNGTALAESQSPHRSLSAYNLKLLEVEPFVHAKVNDRKTLTLSSNQPSLPDGINDVFLDIDYTGDVGLAFINGQLVDDHFYSGRPWRIGLKRFLSRVAEDGMYISLRPIYKDAPFLADLPPSAVPDFSKEHEVLRINQVRVLPEYRAVLSF
ncbi:MAG TPA: beta-galactosidase [Pirellulales bacterium]